MNKFESGPHPVWRLASKYGLRIEYDFTGVNGTRYYKIFTADGCQWENGLTIEGIKRECEEWSNSFLQIKNVVERRGE